MHYPCHKLGPRSPVAVTTTTTAGPLVCKSRLARLHPNSRYVLLVPTLSHHPQSILMGDIYQWATQTQVPGRTSPILPPEWISLQPPLVDSTVENRFLDNVKTLKSLTITNTVALKRLDGLSEHLATTEKGSRHQALYTIARTLGQLVASQHLTRGQISVALHAAAERNALLAEDGTHNITQTINDGISKGIDDGPDTGHHESTERNLYMLPPPSKDNGFISEARKHLLDIGAVIEAEIDDDEQWLIEPIIPAGKSVALYAAGKTGKSLLVFDFVSSRRIRPPNPRRSSTRQHPSTSSTWIKK